MIVTIENLKSTISQILKSYGYSSSESQIIQQVLLFAQLRGNNQGVVKLTGSGIPRIPNGEAITIERETKVSALVNGNRTHAMVALDRATDLIINKAKEIGIAIVGNYNSGESTGALGYYVEKITQSGLVGIAFASAPFKSTAPFGSIDPLLCTNPIAFGIPTKTDPIILDFSTSEMAFFGLIEAQIAGKGVPKGTGYDSAGNDSTVPSEIMSGALKTFAGYKGSGLALITQIFAGPMINAGYIGKEIGNAGNLLIAFDPGIFCDKEELSKKIDDIKAIIKQSRKRSDTNEILLPGERSYKKYHQCMAMGQIEIDDNLWQALCEKLTTN